MMQAHTSEGIPLHPSQASVVTGSIVRLQIQGEAAEWEVMIVDTEEADPESDRISNECPIGEALIGRKAGDVVSVEVPSGKVHYRVLAVAP